jgi:hypothetical protein
MNSGGHVQQITVGLTPASLVYSPLWYRLNFWSIILSFEQTGSLGPLISELRVMLKIVNDKRKKMRELNQKELPFELTKNGQLAKLQNDGLLDKFRNPEQLRPLRKFGFEPADSLDMYDPIPQRLRQFELCESLKKSIPEIKKSNIAKEMIKVENAFKNTPWHQLISASAES